MHHTLKLCRLIGTGLAALSLATWTGTAGAQTALNTGAQAQYEQLYEQIVTMRDAGQDVPHELYDRYFELQQQLYPAPEEHVPPGQTDQASDICPGTEIIQPPVGQSMNFLDAGQTYTAHNNCAYPRCRQGRDVMYKLVLNHPEWLLISTCGSMFDTYLCVFRDSCCGDTSQRVFVNQDAPAICGPLTLQAAIDTCFPLAGTYYITLDGANTGAYGDYVFRIQGRPDRICPPLECTAGYLHHVEAEHPNEGVCEAATAVSCGQGYCGVIDRLGDRDVYQFALTNCAVVTLSAFANDTPARSGYHQGLDPALRLFAGPACDHPLFTNDNVLNNYPDIQGNDARIVTTGGLRPGTYYLEITGVATTGKYEFLITCGPCPD